MSRVAVVLPVYDKDRNDFLQLAIESILNQNNNVDLIIPIDGKINTDKRSLLNSFDKENVTILEYSENRGLAAVLNDGIEFCIQQKYEFIARMDADDISASHRIQKQLDYFGNHHECDVIGSEATVISETGEKIGYKELPEVITFSSLIWGCNIIHPSVMFKAGFFKKFGFYNVFYRKSQDYELWFRAVKAGAVIHNIKENLFQLRYEKEIVNRRKNEQTFNIKLKMKYIPFHIKYFSVIPNLIILLLPYKLLSYLSRKKISNQTGVYN